jgi:hypothetical protein
MKKVFVSVITAAALLFTASAQAAPWGDTLKSVGQAAGQAAVQAAVQKLTPQAQAVVDEAGKLKAGAPQENFLITKANEFLAARNYQPAWDLANYVITTLNSGSVDAKKILADAQAALTKLAQEQLSQTANGAQKVQAEAAAVQQAGADVAQTANSIQGLFGTK